MVTIEHILRLKQTMKLIASDLDFIEDIEVEKGGRDCDFNVIFTMYEYKMIAEQLNENIKSIIDREVNRKKDVILKCLASFPIYEINMDYKFKIISPVKEIIITIEL